MGIIETNPNLQMRRRLQDAFFSYSGAEFKRADTPEFRFVHYTSATVARSIIERRQIWMRNATTMNDFSEIQHGLKCLRHAFASPQGARFRKLIDSLIPRLSEKVDAEIQNRTGEIAARTFLTCFSEHIPGREDRLGRLSMWRAYGGEAGVAIVLKGNMLLSELWNLNVYASPVLYADEGEFTGRFASFVDALEVERELLATLSEHSLLSWILRAFRFAIIATKHPGFSEELEWRLIHSPLNAPSADLDSNLENVRGIPQEVFKMPIELPHKGIRFTDQLDRLIIGPTTYPHVVVQTFTQLLTGLGISPLTNRLVVSDIPLRQQV